ncbi:MAG: hypothetical protein P4L53_00920 [Candidatus Obscuribacterales bacterium]|nr:hypothetical protein [Candidatus Obscuribacterales bacterium]
MSKDSLESPVKPEAAAHKGTDTSRHLLPSIEDFQNFIASGKSTVTPRCDLPDYTIVGHGQEQSLEPTQKRIDYDDLARQALNSPAQGDGKPVSQQEKEIAREVAELTLKAQKDLPKITENLDRDHDNQRLRDIFQKLDPESAQRVIDEANKTLEGHNLRLGQSAVGEVWSGSREKNGDPYYLETRLKDVDCAPSV